MEAQILEKDTREENVVARTVIHKSAIDNIASHKGANNGRSTVKVDGNGATWSGSGNEKKTCNSK